MEFTGPERPGPYPVLKVRSHGATSRRDILQGHVAGSNFIVCHRSKPCRGDKKLSPRHAARNQIDLISCDVSRGQNLLQRLVASCELFRS